MEILVKEARADRFEFEFYQGEGFVRLLINGVHALEFLDKREASPAVYVVPDAAKVLSKIINKARLRIDD